MLRPYNSYFALFAFFAVKCLVCLRLCPARLFVFKFLFLFDCDIATLGVRRLQIVEIVGSDGLISAVRKNHREGQDAEADHDSGQYQRLRERIGKGLGKPQVACREQRRPHAGQTAGGENQEIGGIAEQRQADDQLHNAAAQHEIKTRSV